MFCNCSTKFGNDPNSNICPVCSGQPGSLPVINQKAIELAVKTALALHCTINSESVFARKNYFYPDLPKGYQISQFELPLAEHGHLDIEVGGKIRRIGITRVHLEEDAGKLVHKGSAGIKGADYSLVDLNRTGTPLMEIVSEPDIRTPEEAKIYMQELARILKYLEVCDAKLEEGSLRCDANFSLRPAGQKEFGVKTEVKNMNSFKAVQKALEGETERQTEILNDGGKIIQATLFFDEATGKTSVMRTKESSHDYRYFPEPDLMPLYISKEWEKEIKETLIELPSEKRKRFEEQYRLSAYDAAVLAENKITAAFFEDSAKLIDEPKLIANWLSQDVASYLNQKNLDLQNTKLTPALLAELVELVKKGSISGNTAKEVLTKMIGTGTSPSAIVKESGVEQISDEAALVEVVQAVIKENPAQTLQFKSGKESVLNFFIGQAMRRTKGRANSELLKNLFLKLLRNQ
jgi:aspartyl-tRNA(Asn)/glutamyl-tRNA(Gln) amidotransferase subunit B